MTNMRPWFLLILLATTPGFLVAAQVPSCDDLRRIRDSAARSMSETGRLLAEGIIDEPPASVADMTCLDRVTTLLDTLGSMTIPGINIAIPTFTDVMSGFLNAACEATLNYGMAQLNANLPALNAGNLLPYGLGGVDLGVRQTGDVVQIGVNVPSTVSLGGVPISTPAPSGTSTIFSTPATPTLPIGGFTPPSITPVGTGP